MKPVKGRSRRSKNNQGQLQHNCLAKQEKVKYFSSLIKKENQAKHSHAARLEWHESGFVDQILLGTFIALALDFVILIMRFCFVFCSVPNCDRYQAGEKTFVICQHVQGAVTPKKNNVQRQGRKPIPKCLRLFQTPNFSQRTLFNKFFHRMS